MHTNVPHEARVKHEVRFHGARGAIRNLDLELERLLHAHLPRDVDDAQAQRRAADGPQMNLVAHRAAGWPVGDVPAQRQGAHHVELAHLVDAVRGSVDGRDPEDYAMGPSRLQQVHLAAASAAAAAATLYLLLCQEGLHLGHVRPLERGGQTVLDHEELSMCEARAHVALAQHDHRLLPVLLSDAALRPTVADADVEEGHLLVGLVLLQQDADVSAGVLRVEEAPELLLGGDVHGGPQDSELVVGVRGCQRQQDAAAPPTHELHEAGAILHATVRDVEQPRRVVALELEPGELVHLPHERGERQAVQAGYEAEEARDEAERDHNHRDPHSSLRVDAVLVLGERGSHPADREKRHEQEGDRHGWHPEPQPRHGAQ
mmetsp:Transcript_45726/g.120843  ORF Transcript_45726/g.120843 Transcript_45726/m.120843 type:complete len:374 (+) Transcript_45726:223-1344(+)